MYRELEALEDLEDMEFASLGEDYEDWEDFEGADEFAFEDGEGEGDYFLGGLLKRLAAPAAQAVGGAIAGPSGAKIAGQLASSIFQESAYEYEDELEGDFEAEFEAEGGDPNVLDEMNYWAELAAEAEDEADADHFLGVLGKLAGPLLSSIMGESENYEDYEDWEDYEDGESYEDYEGDYFLPAIPALASMAMPLIGKGIKALGGLFRGRKRRRPSREYEAAVKAIPQIAAKTAVTLKKQQQAGKPVTPKKVAAAMAVNTAKTLKSKPALAKAVQKNRVSANRARQKARQAAAVKSRVMPVRQTRRLPV